MKIDRQLIYFIVTLLVIIPLFYGVGFATYKVQEKITRYNVEKDGICNPYGECFDITYRRCKTRNVTEYYPDGTETGITNMIHTCLYEPVYATSGDVITVDYLVSHDECIGGTNESCDEWKSGDFKVKLRL